jgi:hypothetical protein
MKATISRKSFREDRKRDYHSCHLCGRLTDAPRVRYIYLAPDMFLPVESSCFSITGPRREGQKAIVVDGERVELEWVD